MSWFGFGGDKKPEPTPVIEHSFDNSPAGLSSNSFSSGSDYSSSSSSSLGGFGGGGMEDMQAMQQQVMAQQLILKLTDIAFEKCIKDPSGSLSGSQRSCVVASVSKYIDGTALIIGAMTGQK